MAKNWEEAQVNEKNFWKEIYVDKNPKDKVYEIAKNEDLINFTKQVCKRHEIKIENFSDKVLVDIGCGPFGIIKGLTLIEKDQNIDIKKFFGVDPLMDFFKENIGILKEDEHLKLINSGGEKIPLNDQIADYIFSTNVLDHCYDPQKVISEADRILKNNGEFFCSVHVVYPYLSFIAPFLKYIDKNHPKHFSEKFFLNILKTKFKNIKVTYRAKMFEDHPKFKFSNIISNKNILRGIKRFLSHYILYTAYFSCKK